MRVLKALLTAGLLRSAGAVLEAPVYTFDGPNRARTGSGIPTISPENARLFFAHRLHLSQYHNLGDADEATLEVLNTYGGIQQKLFGAEDDNVRRTLVIVEGLENPEGIYDGDATPAFKINDIPSSSSNIQLVLDLLNQDRHRRKASTSCDGSNKNGYLTSDIKGGFSSNEPLGTCMVHGVGHERFRKLTDIEKLELISASSPVVADNVYSSSRSDDSMTTVLHISHLETIARKQGTNSQAYKTIVSELKRILSDLSSSNKHRSTTVVLLPLVTKHAKRSTNLWGTYSNPDLSKRQALAEQPLAASSSTTSSAVPSSTSKPSNATTPKTTLSSCFASEKACNKATISCSGHGKCALKYAEKVADETTGAECWSCACVPTVIETTDDKTGKKSIKTTYWGGPACQKKDISSPFLLFAGFTILLVTAISYAVSAMYSMGSQELPSVLAAGVAPPPRK